MAFTIEQEQALLALLNEKKLTLSELPLAAELAEDDLMLIRQGVLDKSVNNDVLKKYFTPPASSLVESGIVKLSNAINSDDEFIAATSKAVKSAHNLALNASQSVAEQALSKSANLSDVADKEEVLKNLGLLEFAGKMIGDGSGQIPDMSFFTGMLTGTTGWFKIPISGFGSLICQFGLTPIGATRAVTFPIPFPSAVLGVIHFDHGFNSTVGGSTWGTGNRTRFGFTGYCNTPSEGGSYLAWGI